MSREDSGVIPIETGRRLRRRRSVPPEDRTEFVSRRFRRLTLAILIAGLAAAAVVFVTAGPTPENPLGYDPLDTKLYRRELEVYGGTANVLAAEFMDWFGSLWHGRTLAYTIAVLTLVTVQILRFSAKLYLVGEDDPEDPAAPDEPGA